MPADRVGAGFHPLEHAGNGNRSDPQKRLGSNCHPFTHACHDARPGRGLLVRTIRRRERGNELRLLFLRPMHGGNLREWRLLPAEWILRPTKLSAHAHATLGHLSIRLSLLDCHDRTCPMHIALRWLFALLLVLGGATTVGSRAQTAPEAPGDHTLEGDHHSGGHSDRGYHRSFDQAEKWAKEFDDPSRDAWQKPNEVLDALHLDRTARVADLAPGRVISARASPGSSPKGNCSQLTSSRTCCVSSGNARNANI
jgi:hypothetical protein